MSGWVPNQIGSVISPEEAGGGLIRTTAGGVQGLCPSLVDQLGKCEIVLIHIVDSKPHRRISEQVIFLGCDPPSNEAVEGRRIHTNGTRRTFGFVDIDRNDADRVGRIVIEPVTALGWTVSILVERRSALIEYIQDSPTHGSSKKVARRGCVEIRKLHTGILDELSEDCGDGCGCRLSRGCKQLIEYHCCSTGDCCTRIGISGDGR